MEAVLDLERLAQGPLFGTGAHDTGRDPSGVPGLDAHVADFAGDALLPELQVDSGQGVAVDPGVQERIRDVEESPLDGGQLVAVVANDLGERGLTNLGQLGLGEADERVAALVPKPITFPQVSELDSNDAREGGADQTTVEGSLSKTAYGKRTQKRR